jgi:hypothetical protein
MASHSTGRVSSSKAPIMSFQTLISRQRGRPIDKIVLKSGRIVDVLSVAPIVVHALSSGVESPNGQRIGYYRFGLSGGTTKGKNVAAEAVRPFYALNVAYKGENKVVFCSGSHPKSWYYACCCLRRGPTFVYHFIIDILLLC